MDLTDADVTDILALLDSLPYDELDLETSRFRLTLRRTPARLDPVHPSPVRAGPVIRRHRQPPWNIGG